MRSVGQKALILLAASVVVALLGAGCPKASEQSGDSVNRPADLESVVDRSIKALEEEGYRIALLPISDGPGVAESSVTGDSYVIRPDRSRRGFVLNDPWNGESVKFSESPHEEYVSDAAGYAADYYKRQEGFDAQGWIPPRVVLVSSHIGLVYEAMPERSGGSPLDSAVGPQPGSVQWWQSGYRILIRGATGDHLTPTSGLLDIAGIVSEAVDSVPVE